jgi:hypothetical protein
VKRLANAEDGDLRLDTVRRLFDLRPDEPPSGEVKP